MRPTSYNLLTIFLSPYRSPTNGTELIQNRILKADAITDLNLSELKSFLPKSNWARYFAEIVNCDDGFLNKRWEKLYALRNLVAHNSMLSKSDYDDILKLIGEVEKPIQEAIDNLDKLHIPEDEKETIAENFASNRGPLYGEFILLWKQIEAELKRIQKTISSKSQPKRFRGSLSAIEDLKNAQLVNKLQYYDLDQSRRIRNMIVHQSDNTIKESLLVKAIFEAEVILDWLQQIPPLKMVST